MANVRTNFKPQRRRHFIREWRKHRGLTLEQLAERVGLTHGAISQLERYQTGYTQPTLEAIALALNCEPADLLMRDPSNTDAPWSIWETLPPAERTEALDYMQFLKERGARKAN